MPNFKICIWPLQNLSIWGCPCALHQKITRNKKFLEFNFRVGIFNAQNLKSKLFKDPQIWGRTPKPALADQKVAEHKMLLEINCRAVYLK